MEIILEDIIIVFMELVFFVVGGFCGVFIILFMIIDK